MKHPTLKTSVWLVMVFVLQSSLLLAGPSKRQVKPPKWTTRNLLDVAWATAQPITGPDTIPNSFSYNGVLLGYRWKVKSASIGIRNQWNLFKAPGPSAEVHRLLSWQIGANAHYYFVPKKTIMPFVGLGLGSMKTTAETIEQEDILETESWYFHCYPEAGAVTYLGRIPLSFAINYHMGFAKNETPITFVGFQLGISLPN